jgi:hypothetical protein
MSSLDWTCWGQFFWFVQARSDKRWDITTDIERRGVGCAGALVLWFVAAAIVNIAIVGGV